MFLLNILLIFESKAAFLMSFLIDNKTLPFFCILRTEIDIIYNGVILKTKNKILVNLNTDKKFLVILKVEGAFFNQILK